jgi:hypothetical protein
MPSLIACTKSSMSSFLQSSDFQGLPLSYVLADFCPELSALKAKECVSNAEIAEVRDVCVCVRRFQLQGQDDGIHADIILFRVRSSASISTHKKCMCTYVFVHTHTHIHGLLRGFAVLGTVDVYTFMHAYIHTYVCWELWMYTLMHAYIHTYMHMNTDTWEWFATGLRCVGNCGCIHIHACIHTYTHTCI